MNTLQLSKGTMIDAIDRFETKHLLYIEYPTMLRNCFIISILIGNVARLYYNTFELQRSPSTAVHQRAGGYINK